MILSESNEVLNDIELSVNGKCVCSNNSKYTAVTTAHFKKRRASLRSFSKHTALPNLRWRLRFDNNPAKRYISQTNS